MSVEEWGDTVNGRLSFTTVRETFLTNLRELVADELGPRVQAHIYERMSPTGGTVTIVEEFLLCELDRSVYWAEAVAQYARECEPEFLALLLENLPIEGFVVEELSDVDYLALALTNVQEPKIIFKFTVAADTPVVADREQIKARDAAERKAFVAAAARQVAMQILRWDNSDTTYPLECPVLITGGKDDSKDFLIETLDRVRQYWRRRIKELQEQLTASPHISGYRIAVSEDGISLTPDSVSFICLVSPVSDSP